MGKPTGFLEFKRVISPDRSIPERRKDYAEVTRTLTAEQVQIQGARCMDCGIPFCHNGCPVNNVIPEWNDLVYRERWDEALSLLHSTNNFPEVTGRICPAPCESACVLGINDDPVSIKTIERAIADEGIGSGTIPPRITARNGRSVAVVGSGPAGLAAAQQLARSGYSVDLYEKNDRIGGLLRYGIPDFKLAKEIVNRRMVQMEAEGVRFHTGVEIGTDKKVSTLQDEYAAVLLTLGAEQPRDLEAPGRNYPGVHFAMDFLRQQNRRVAGDTIKEAEAIHAAGKRVIVIGGGDTGSDCVGTANRQGALLVHQLELMPRPPKERAAETPWPMWPNKLRTSSSHEEGCERMWNINTREILGDSSGVREIVCVGVQWDQDENGRWSMEEVCGSEFNLSADLILLAMGFMRPVHMGLIDQLGVRLDNRGTISTGVDFATSIPGVFAAGDARRGASLVVWAIREGRLAASSIDRWIRSEDTLGS